MSQKRPKKKDEKKSKEKILMKRRPKKTRNIMSNVFKFEKLAGVVNRLYYKTRVKEEA